MNEPTVIREGSDAYPIIHVHPAEADGTAAVWPIDIFRVVSVEGVRVTVWGGSDMTLAQAQALYAALGRALELAREV